MTNWTYISKALSVLAIDLVAEYISSVIHGGSVPLTISFSFFISLSLIKKRWEIPTVLIIFSIPLFLC